jgi:cytoskeletal protein RodZ
MSEQMSIEDIEKALDRRFEPITENLKTIMATLEDARKELSDQKVQSVKIETEFKNHKEQQKEDLKDIKEDLKNVADKTRMNTKFVWGFNSVVTAFIIGLGVFIKVFK